MIYLSICNDYKFGIDHEITQNVLSHDPAWWCYIHQRNSMVLFILYIACNILFSNKDFYIYVGTLHIF